MEGEAPADGSDRDWLRIGVVLCCLLVAVAASFLMPTFAADGLAGSPIDQILPGEGSETDAPPASGSLGTGAAGGLGALNPGDATGVGGEVTLDSDTYATTDTELHFTVETTSEAYWRTGSFDSYTGSGWERTGDIEPLEGSVEHEGINGEQIDYEVTLEQSATAVPTPWRPAVVEGVENPLVTEDGAIRTETPIEPGTTIEGVSFAPEDDVGQLRSAERNYPEQIRQQYTQLPEDTSERIGLRTREIIDQAGAEGPYEEAAAVQEWLRSSKEYDLGVSERSENIAETFIFEMEAGYCEYFATAMVTMLRSQDIPSRYVVGYSTGQEVEDGVYEVRAMNAHAWVEVYFEEFGWVKFDPTPGGDRLATQEQALSDVDDEFNLTEPGSPGEVFEPASEDENEQTPGLDISLNRSAVPGEPVEVTVTYDDVPVPGVEVYFNGEPVGITDREGRAVGTVPDAGELEITIEPGDEPTPPALEQGVFGEDSETVEPRLSGGGASFGGGGVTVAGTDVTASTVKKKRSKLGSDEHSTGEQQTDDDVGVSETYPVERTATLVVSGDPAQGERVAVTVRAADVSLSGATITLEGETVGETDEDGQIALDLPERTGDVSIGARRGSISGETTVTVPQLSVDVQTGLLGSFAFGSGTVEAELDDEPAAGVPVLIDGEEVAVTGPDGTASVDFPLGVDATLSVEAAGQREQVTVSGLLYVPVVVGTLLAGFAGMVGVAMSRHDVSPRRLVRLLASLPRKLIVGGGRTLLVVVGRGDRFLATVTERLRRGLLVVVGLFRGKVAPEEAWSGVRGWAVRLRRRLGMTVAGLLPADRSEESPEGLTVREAWQRFLETISVTGAATRTPGELAAHAVEEDELPEEPVYTLRDTFREVEYGARHPSDRLDRLEEAIEQIERADGERD